MTAQAQLVPFGLTFRTPSNPDGALSLMLRTAAYDQESQMAVFNGRPLSELSASDRMVISQPTETDGKDPIAVDSDPFYDK